MDILDLLKRDVAHHGRKAERRLVEHQQARFKHQASPDSEHLLLAAAHRASQLLTALG